MVMGCFSLWGNTFCLTFGKDPLHLDADFLTSNKNDYATVHQKKRPGRWHRLNCTNMQEVELLRMNIEGGEGQAVSPPK